MMKTKADLETGSIRILVVRTDRLGDVVLTLPLLPRLRRNFPQAQIFMLLRRYTGAVAMGHPALDGTFWYDDERGLIPFRKILGTLRAGRFDVCFIVHPTARLAFLTALARMRIRVGSGYRWYSFLFNRRIYTHRKTAERHEVEYNLDLLRGFLPSGHAEDPPEFFIHIPDGARRRIEEIRAKRGNSGRYVVVHPGTGGSSRIWPLESFGTLIRRLSESHHIAFFVTGVPSEEAEIRTLMEAVGRPLISLCGILNLKELAALLEGAILFISNSTGPLHMAVAVGTPVLGFYPQIPVMGARRWGPYTSKARVLVPRKPLDCSLCRKKGSPCQCMASISVEEAYDAACELLAVDRIPSEYGA
jgi:heptosyltransferase-3